MMRIEAVTIYKDDDGDIHLEQLVEGFNSPDTIMLNPCQIDLVCKELKRLAKEGAES